MYQDKVLRIKETTLYSENLNAIYSKEFHDPILLAVGYRNQVLLVSKNKIEHLLISRLDFESSDFYTHSKTYTYQHPLMKTNTVSDVKFFNSGWNVIVAYPYESQILSRNLQVLEVKSFSIDFKVIVPKMEGRSYIIYSRAEIVIYRLSNVNEIKIHPDYHKITIVKTTSFNGLPHLVIYTQSRHLYLDRNELKSIWTNGDFMLLMTTGAFG